MKELTSFDFEDEDIRSYSEEELLIINIKKNSFEIITEVSESNYLFDLLNLAEQSPQIKVIFMYNDTGCLGEEVYDDYLKNLLTRDKNATRRFSSDHTSQLTRQRQISLMNRFILEALNTEKLFISGLCGCVVTPFFGASLALDLRFASNDMVFSLAHRKYGIHPTGALPFFLPKYIGLNQTKDLLFREETISAKKAFELGLVNQIFPKENFPDHCIDELKKLCLLDMNVIRTTKKLIKVDPEEVEKYFDKEEMIVFF